MRHARVVLHVRESVQPQVTLLPSSEDQILTRQESTNLGADPFPARAVRRSARRSDGVIDHRLASRD